MWGLLWLCTTFGNKRGSATFRNYQINFNAQFLFRKVWWNMHFTKVSCILLNKVHYPSKWLPSMLIVCIRYWRNPRRNFLRCTSILWSCFIQISQSLKIFIFLRFFLETEAKNYSREYWSAYYIHELYHWI